MSLTVTTFLSVDGVMQDPAVRTRTAAVGSLVAGTPRDGRSRPTCSSSIVTSPGHRLGRHVLEKTEIDHPLCTQARREPRP